MNALQLIQRGRDKAQQSAKPQLHSQAQEQCAPVVSGNSLPKELRNISQYSGQCCATTSGAITSDNTSKR
jgi:hypothetical protein